MRFGAPKKGNKTFKQKNPKLTQTYKGSTKPISPPSNTDLILESMLLGIPFKGYKVSRIDGTITVKRTK
jgi:hypothetical protein